MAKKETKPNMVDQFTEFKEHKNIDKTTMINVLTESFRKVLANMFGTDDNIDVILNPDKGDVQIFQRLEVVEDGNVTDKVHQIALSEARQEDPEAEVGETFDKEIIFENFGRRAILTLRQTLQSKILDLQKESVYNKYKDMVGELVSGEVYQAWSRETLVLDDEKNEMFLPKAEAIPGDYFRKGDTVRAVIQRVDNENNNPKITLSRTSDKFLRRLFELEVPEIHDGLISIRAVARIPGERAKIAVESYDDRIDPVGACVGVKGSRIHGIVRELHNENIDVIAYTSNPQLLIQRALSPARISSIRFDEEKKKAEVFIRPEEVSLAIGKNGYNIKLAIMLSGIDIEVYRDDASEYNDDIYLDDFRDEIDSWVIDILKTYGMNTARQVLQNSRERLLQLTDLEECTVDHVLDVIKAEFENDDDEEADDEPVAPADEPATDDNASEA